MGFRGRKIRDSIADIDSITDRESILFVDEESLVGAIHDRNIYEKFDAIAKEKGINGRIVTIAFGATDGVPFSKNGIPAISIIGTDVDKDLLPYYHTRLDTPDVIDPKSLGDVLKICMEYVKQIDKEA
ncbi:MAG: M28 family peptidase [Promethearchaeota archaeon]